MRTKKTLKTSYSVEKEDRDAAIYHDWTELMSQEGAMATAVEKIIMDKYKIHSRATIWNARQRAAQRIEQYSK
jgi:hypothetical protein